MTSVVVFGLSVAMIILLLVIYFATTRQERKGQVAMPPPMSSPPPEEGRGMPVSSPVRVGSDIPDPRTIKVNDTIECPGVHARVYGALHLSWRGRQWTQYLLDDGPRRRSTWLAVEELQPSTASDQHAMVQVLLWTAVPTQGMVPAKSMLIMEGVEFHPVERGTAAFRAEGDTGFPERGLMDFAQYRADDGRILCFERVQGEPWTAAYANPLPPGSITIERAPI